MKLSTNQVARMYQLFARFHHQYNRMPRIDECKTIPGFDRKFLRAMEREGYLVSKRFRDSTGQIWTTWGIPKWKPQARLLWWFTLLKRWVAGILHKTSFNATKAAVGAPIPKRPQTRVRREGGSKDLPRNGAAR